MAKLGALGLVAAACLLGGCSLGGYDSQGARVEHFQINSRDAGRNLRQTAVLPPGSKGQGRPLLVFLHGRGNDEDTNLTDRMFAGLHALGDRAPVVVFPNGGGGSYWHDRGSGDWGSYVLGEVIPEAHRRFGTDPRRVAIGGISMGGFGALNLARRHPGRFCAVGAHSPALWRTGGETAPGAFDDAQDFARNDVVGAARSDPGAFGRQPLWLDAGTEDPFDAGDRAFVAAIRASGGRIEVHRSPGSHEGSYWSRNFPRYLRFYGRALANCRR